MKLCIPCSEANGLESSLEPHFPQASHLMVFDTDTRQHSFISVHQESEQDDLVIDAVLCGSINRMVLRSLLDQGVQVYGTPASHVQEAIGQFERGELEAVGIARTEGEQAESHGCCGGRGHGDEDHECGCGSHDDPDHECCGGHGHDDPDHECCGGKGHGHRHGSEGGCGCRH